MKTAAKYLVLAIVLACGFAALAPNASAQAGVPLWTNRYDGPASSYDDAHAIAVDSNGNVFVTGKSHNGSGRDWDYATVKYSAAGDLLWVNRYDGGGGSEDVALGIAVDSNGNVFVTGQSGFVGGGWDIKTIKYSGAGDEVWINRHDGPNNGFDTAYAIAVDSNGNVFVAGTSAGVYATIKYSNDGVPLWTNRYPGPTDLGGEAYAIALDGSSNVIVTGSSRTSFQDPSTTDYLTIKYSTDGVPLWTNRFDAPGDYEAHAYAIAVGGNDNVFVTGSWRGNDSYYSATLAYSSTGVPLWTNYFPTHIPFAKVLAADSGGNVFVSGSSATIKYSNTGVPLWTNQGYFEAVALDSSGNVFATGNLTTIAYSNSGVPLGTNQYDGPGYYPTSAAITVDTGGNVIVTGRSEGSGTARDYVTINYSSSIPPPRLDFQKLNNELVLSWTNAGFHLQTAPAVTGPFTNLPTASNPYTNLLTAPQQFFRLAP